MNKRTLQIIHLLLEKKIIEIHELEKQFSVTSRSIRNDVRTINDLLITNGLLPLEIKQGAIRTEEDFSSIAAVLETVDLYSYKLSSSDRVAIAAMQMTAANGYVTLADQADRLFISRQTMIKDLPLIKKLVRSFGLEIVSQANKGLRVEGDELHKRELLFRLYRQSSATIRKFVHITRGDLTVLTKIVREQEGVACIFLTDDSFDDILLWLRISISRIHERHDLHIAAGEQESSFYMFSQNIWRFICQYMNVEIVGPEIDGLVRILEHARYLHKQEGSLDVLKAQMLTRRYIQTVSMELGVDLNTDYVFFENLSAHVLSVLSGQEPEYPDSMLLHEMIEENPGVYEAANNAKHVFSSFARRELRNIDVEYICVHILAALEKHKNQQVNLRVVLACHGGVGTSQYLAQRLKRYFDFRIVDIVSAHYASTLDASFADLIISTVPLTQTNIEHVVISPLFNDEDYIRIVAKSDQVRQSRYMDNRMSASGPNAKELIRELEPIVQQIAPEHASALNKALRKTIRDYFREPAMSDSEIFSPYLHHLLPASRIQIDVEAEDWKEAIRKAAEPMIARHSIERRYVERMIRNIEENGPYIVLVPGFAMPHEGIDAGAIRTDFQLIRLVHPVDFHHDEFDPVRYVCCLSAADQKTHLKAFFNLVSMLQHPNFLSRLDAAATPEEMAQIIEQFEYELC